MHIGVQPIKLFSGEYFLHEDFHFISDLSINTMWGKKTQQLTTVLDMWLPCMHVTSPGSTDHGRRTVHWSGYNLMLVLLLIILMCREAWEDV